MRNGADPTNNESDIQESIRKHVESISHNFADISSQYQNASAGTLSDRALEIYEEHCELERIITVYEDVSQSHMHSMHQIDQSEYLKGVQRIRENFRAGITTILAAAELKCSVEDMDIDGLLPRAPSQQMIDLREIISKKRKELRKVERIGDQREGISYEDESAADYLKQILRTKRDLKHVHRESIDPSSASSTASGIVVSPASTGVKSDRKNRGERRSKPGNETSATKHVSSLSMILMLAGFAVAIQVPPTINIETSNSIAVLCLTTCAYANQKLLLFDMECDCFDRCKTYLDVLDEEAQHQLEIEYAEKTSSHESNFQDSSGSASGAGDRFSDFTYFEYKPQPPSPPPSMPPPSPPPPSPPPPSPPPPSPPPPSPPPPSPPPSPPPPNPPPNPPPPNPPPPSSPPPNPPPPSSPPPSPPMPVSTFDSMIHAKKRHGKESTDFI